MNLSMNCGGGREGGQPSSFLLDLAPSEGGAAATRLEQELHPERARLGRRQLVLAVNLASRLHLRRSQAEALLRRSLVHARLVLRGHISHAQQVLRSAGR